MINMMSEYRKMQQATKLIQDRTKQGIQDGTHGFLRKEECIRLFIKSFETQSRRSSYAELFNDMLDYFLWFSSWGQMDISELQKKYTKKDFDLFAEMMDIVVSGMVNFNDILGDIYMEIASRWKQKNMGQFFTPEPIAEFMTQILFGSREEVEANIKSKDGYVVGDPSGCGSGRMLLAIGKVFGKDLIRKSRVIGTDLDHTCVKITIFNMFCYQIPATIFHENSLSGKIFNIYHVNRRSMMGTHLPSVQKVSDEQVELVQENRYAAWSAGNKARNEDKLKTQIAEKEKQKIVSDSEKIQKRILKQQEKGIIDLFDSSTIKSV